MKLFCDMEYQSELFLTRKFLYVVIPLYPVIFCSEKIFYNGYSLTAQICILIYTYMLGACMTEDIFTRTIPDFYNAVLFISGVIFSYETQGFLYAAQRLLKIIILFAVLILLFFVAKSGIGGGDIKMIAASASMIGIINALSAFFTATILAFPICLFILIKDRLQFITKTKKTKQPLSVPFGPFLACCIYFYLYNTL